MNGFGVGLSVALGAGIGARLALPDVYPGVLLMGMLWWGMIFGFIFQLYQLALHGAHLPFRRRKDMDRLRDTPRPAQNSPWAIGPHRLRFEATRSEE